MKGNQKSLRKFIAAQFSGHEPVFGSPEKGHGRIEQRAIAVRSTSAMSSSFTYARCIIAVWSRRTIRNKTTETVRYYISSLTPKSHSENRWQMLIRGHWGGVENRNHWSKDAVWQEDRTRSRNPSIVGNLALVRNALLRVYINHKEFYESLPAFTETVRSDSNLAFRFVYEKL